ncbi:hypothetical protein [Marinicrinis lubricantis]|uniref:Transposase n=1 Tax=Marinicrinis lubricantis TaxID=2086470 RepID=A0ABW1ITC0_9BACL
MSQGVLERKNEILKRKIESLLLKENQKGLTHLDSYLKNSMIKELHSNIHSLRSH